MFNYKIEAQLELRLLALGDAQRFFDLVGQNQEHIGAWMFWINEAYSLDDARRHIRLALDRWKDNNGFEAGIWFNGELAGAIYYSFIDWRHRNTELGYWLGESFQGRGIATKACRALTDYAFTALGLNRVEIRCMRENVRSRRIPERLGFVKEGVLRQVRWRLNHFDDHVVYGMLASEWQSSLASKDDDYPTDESTGS